MGDNLEGTEIGPRSRTKVVLDEKSSNLMSLFQMQGADSSRQLEIPLIKIQRGVGQLWTWQGTWQGQEGQGTGQGQDRDRTKDRTRTGQGQDKGQDKAKWPDRTGTRPHTWPDRTGRKAHGQTGQEQKGKTVSGGFRNLTAATRDGIEQTTVRMWGYACSGYWACIGTKQLCHRTG